jgi:hypothetical protein
MLEDIYLVMLKIIIIYFFIKIILEVFGYILILILFLLRLIGGEKK